MADLPVEEVAVSAFDWDPVRYGAFRDLRLRPALDLLAQVPESAAGDVVDLGCGDGAVGSGAGCTVSDALLDRGGCLGGDAGEEQCRHAAAAMSQLTQADIADWPPDRAARR